MNTYKVGEILLISATLTFVKVVSVRKSGNLITLWVKTINGGEFSMNAIHGSSLFILKCGKFSENGEGRLESPVIKATKIIRNFFIVLILMSVYYFFGG